MVSEHLIELMSYFKICQILENDGVISASFDVTITCYGPQKRYNIL